MQKIDISTPKHPNIFALVDDEVFEWLNQWKWSLSSSGHAYRRQYIRLGVNKYTAKIIWMHRLINKTPDDLITDHLNQKKLDNRKSNLRNANKSLNSINRGMQSNNKSGFKGVYWDTWAQKWRAEIILNYKNFRLGRFSKIEDAVEARQKAELKYHVI
jgi:hypothetical protein